MTVFQRIAKWGWVIIVSFLFVSLAAMFIIFKNFGCGETLIYKIPSPNASKVIYVFQSGCGPGSSSSLHYLLDYKGRTDLTDRKDLKRRDEFYRQTRGGSYAEWLSENDIEIVYSQNFGKNRFFHKRRTELEDVRIRYTDQSKKSPLR